MELLSANRINQFKTNIENTTGNVYSNLFEGIEDLRNNYEQGSGGDENFVGIKLSEFNYRWAPLVADMSTLPVGGNYGGFTYLFCNMGTNPNAGFYTSLRDVYLPKGITTIAMSMFCNCACLENIYGDCSTIGNIQQSAFSNCFALKKLPYMPNLSYIANSALSGSGVTEVRFYRQASFQSNAFGGSNVTDIYVPWAEGEVTGAPWGATKATIHYNTTYNENHEPIIMEE